MKNAAKSYFNGLFIAFFGKTLSKSSSESLFKPITGWKFKIAKKIKNIDLFKKICIGDFVFVFFTLW